LQARAFTIGRDVVFGPGEYAPESTAGRRLLAHELTHVVQQSQRQSTLQAKIQRQANEVASDAVATRERAGPGLIVDDSAVELNPGQVRKSEFLAELRAEVCAAADEAMAATGQNTEGCPYLDAWFDYYRDKDAQHCERSLRKFAPEAARATTAREYIPVVTARVRRSVATWARTGEITGVPEELRSAIIGGNILSAMGSVASGIGDAVSNLAGGIGKGLSAAGGLFFKARAGGPNNVGDPQAIQAQLGAGNPLDGSVRSRMGTAFGYDFSKVRVHRDSTAADMANRFNARAFTVGNHVAFGSGEYQPGTLTGDAILAHELAHVAQQTSSNATSSGNSVDQALEGDADMSAAMVVTGLLGNAGRVFSAWGARPRLKSGLRLSRCNGDKTKASPNWTVDELKKMLDTCDGGLGIWEKAKKANKDNDPTIVPGAGGWTITSTGEITLDKTQDKCFAVQQLIQELSNLSRKADFEQLDASALAGDVSRADYIKRTEKIEYETGVKNVLTAFDACKDKWPCTTTPKEWARKAKDFDEYFDKLLNDTHKEGYGKWWDDNCKAAYDRKHGRK
jgi:hypothetical protein